MVHLCNFVAVVNRACLPLFRYVDVHEEDDEDEGPVWVSRTDTDKSEANESNR